MRRLLVLGANGMLGYTLLRRLIYSNKYVVNGTMRTVCPRVPGALDVNMHVGVDAFNIRSVSNVLQQFRPDVLINCIGLIKQRESSNDLRLAVAINSIFPHRLASLCSEHGCKLIHFSTDCVFAGNVGNYQECDPADATDVYGRSKQMGEVDYGGHLTLRTSLIGHEIESCLSLVEWFLARRGRVSGYSRVFFSGLPTVEVARVLDEYILSEHELSGLYHLSAEPIDKHRLLCLIAHTYGHAVDICECDEPRLNRSLDSSRLRRSLNYRPPSWGKLITEMHSDYEHHFAPLRASLAYAL